MEPTQDWISYQCACGFRLDHVPRNVVADLPRCLGCGRSLRPQGAVRTRAVTNVRGLR